MWLKCFFVFLLAGIQHNEIQICVFPPAWDFDVFICEYLPMFLNQIAQSVLDSLGLKHTANLSGNSGLHILLHQKL